MRRHILLAATAAITIATTAGCSSGGTTPRSQAASTDSTTPNGETQDNRPEERMTPLSAFFTGGRGEPSAADREAADEDFRRLEQLKADCMTEQGFQYIPMDVNIMRETKVKNTEAFDLPPDQYAERWGYGISTIDASQLKAEGPEDPNSAIVSALSPAARSAYEMALYGMDISGSGEPVIMSIENESAVVARPKEAGVDSAPPDGCQSRAMKEVYGEEAVAGRGKETVAEFDGLNEEMGALWDRVANDPRVAAAKQAWADCMGDAGHPEVTDPDSPTQKVIERFSALYGVDPGEFKQVRVGMKDAPQQPDAAALAAMQSYERSMAVADHRCRKGYDDVVFDVQSEVEERFIEEHRAELERYRDASGVKGVRGRGFVGGKG